MIQMLTLFGNDISKLSYNELAREKQTQKALLVIVRKTLHEEQKRNAAFKTKLAKEDNGFNQRSVRISDDKVALLESYEDHLNFLIKELDYRLSRKAEPESNATANRSRKSIREANARKRRALMQQGSLECRAKKAMEYDGMLVSWDREKFMLIAEDNGYQTEESAIYAVAEELNLTRARAESLMSRGRFTWGQVLCLGAMMSMTPKEFCDTFLAGYFVDQYGEYRADYENLCKEELLRRAIKTPKNIFEDMEEVIVGSDGRPLDEEEWITD